MTTAPAIAMIAIAAMQAAVTAVILRKRWMQFFALGCAVFEIGALAVLIYATRS